MKDLDIKKVWDQSDGLERDNFKPELVQKLIDQGSVGVISQFIKTLKWEMWINLIALTSLAMFLFLKGMWAIGLGSVAIDFVFFYYYKVLINKLEKKIIDQSVLLYLQSAYSNIIKFISHYELASLVLAVPAFGLGLYLANNDIFLKESYSETWILTIVIAGFLLTMVLVYFFLDFLYGRKARKIKALIKELSSEENASFEDNTSN